MFSICKICQKSYQLITYEFYYKLFSEKQERIREVIPIFCINCFDILLNKIVSNWKKEYKDDLEFFKWVKKIN